MSFTDDGSPVAGCQSLPLPTVAPLQVSCTETYESTTPHSVVAGYSGDEDDAGSSASLVQAVGEVPTQTTVTSSSPTPTYGENATLTATVTPTGNTPADPTGTVTFYDYETTAIATVAVSTAAGTTTATLDTSSIMGGLHAITASYDGNRTSATSSSSAPAMLERGRGGDDGDGGHFQRRVRRRPTRRLHRDGQLPGRR